MCVLTALCNNLGEDLRMSVMVKCPHHFGFIVYAGVYMRVSVHVFGLNILLLFFSSTSITFFFHSSKVGMSSLPGTGGSVPPSGSATFTQDKTTLKLQFNLYNAIMKSRRSLCTDEAVKFQEVYSSCFCMAKPRRLICTEAPCPGKREWTSYITALWKGTKSFQSEECNPSKHSINRTHSQWHLHEMDWINEIDR